jgi:hypothetical protein
VDGANLTATPSTSAFSTPQQHYTLTVVAPTKAGRLGLRVSAASGFEQVVTGEALTVVRPDVDVCVVCPGETDTNCATTCELTASTGNATLQVIAPRSLQPATGTLRSFLDLVPLTETKPFTFDLLDGALQGGGTLTIPDLESSDQEASWLLSAVVAEGSYPTGGIAIKLRAPKPTVIPPSGCLCDGSCTVNSEQKVVFKTRIDPDVRFPSSTLEHGVNGGAQLASLTGALVNGEVSVTATAPVGAADWVLRARVGPYASDACTLKVTAP